MQLEAFIQKDINAGEVTPTKKLQDDSPDEHYSLGLRQLETTGKKATEAEPMPPTNHKQNTEYRRKRKTLSMYDYKKFKHIDDINTKYRFGEHLGMGSFGKV